MTDVVTEDTDLAWPAREGAVNQPRRAVFAAVDVVVAGLLGWLAVWMWGQGIDVVGVVRDRPDLVVDRFQGQWIGGSVAVATLGLILILDAVRQLVLAVRSRSR
ncbi:hypothetical protein [Alloactinosynnema sp. L-07]|uniref:hypothetical protein n=1 Tax=Alloactinosynnema sp. L-07 TaxID=1653480 RepID=UPI00065F04E5|nr:hypothetical protein [Alloactinosynnema sp. L-07]CRK60192.1 hypothetical protein [Alloactinosynnema sp. L-07]